MRSVTVFKKRMKQRRLATGSATKNKKNGTKAQYWLDRGGYRKSGRGGSDMNNQ